MEPDISTMAPEELAAYSDALKVQIGQLQAKRLQIQDVLSRRLAAERAEAVAAGLTDDEREALAQVLTPGGIDGKSAVGTPGG